MADREERAAEEAEEQAEDAEEAAEDAEEAAEDAEEAAEDAEEGVNEVLQWMESTDGRLARMETLLGEMTERMATHAHESTTTVEERETVEPPERERIHPIPDHPYRRLPHWI